MEGAPEHTRVPIFFYCQSLQNREVRNMSMDSRRTVHDLCVELSKKNGIDPKRMTLIIRGKVADRDMSLEMTNLHKHDTVRVLVKDGTLHEHDEDDDSPPDPMSLCHGRSIPGDEATRCTVLVEFMAPYFDTQMVCVVHGAMHMRVGDLHRIVSEKTAVMTERMWFYKNGNPLDPSSSFKDAGFGTVTRVVMRTTPKAGTSGEWPAIEAGSPSREPFTPDYSNEEEDE